MIWLMQNGVGSRALHVIGVVDDDPWKRGMRIHGVPVLGDRQQIPSLVREHDVGLIVFAIHNISASEQEAILTQCRATPARVVVVPDIPALLTRLARPQAGGPLAPSANDGAKAAGNVCPWALPTSPLVRIEDRNGVHIEVRTLSNWVKDLANLVAEGRVNEVKARLIEMQILLDQGPAPTTPDQALTPVSLAPSQEAQRA